MCLIYLDPKAVDLINQRDDVKVLSSQSASFLNIAMMLDREPSNDPNFRMAMKYAIDRDAIVNNVMKGFAHVGNDHPISPIDPYYCSDVEQRVYDPDQAKFYFEKTGLSGTPIDFYASDVPGQGGWPAPRCSRNRPVPPVSTSTSSSRRPIPTGRPRGW